MNRLSPSAAAVRKRRGIAFWFGYPFFDAEAEETGGMLSLFEAAAHESRSFGSPPRSHVTHAAAYAWRELRLDRLCLAELRAMDMPDLWWHLRRNAVIAALQKKIAASEHKLARRPSPQRPALFPQANP